MKAVLKHIIVKAYLKPGTLEVSLKPWLHGHTLGFMGFGSTCLLNRLSLQFVVRCSMRSQLIEATGNR